MTKHIKEIQKLDVYKIIYEAKEKHPDNELAQTGFFLALVVAKQEEIIDVLNKLNKEE